MKITFLGATHEVTGSMTYLEVNGHRLLVDCGMEQGRNIFENEDIPVPASEIESIVLTHAHIDHSGRIPWLYRNGFRGSVYATEATSALCEIMLLDSAHIQESEAEWKNRKAQRAGGTIVEPLYTQEDAQNVVRRFVPIPYGKRTTVLDGVDICFRDIGHLLGSAAVEMWMTEDGVTKKMVFSGDVGNKEQLLLNNPNLIEEADYVMIESTYGDRLHEQVAAHESYTTQLTECIQRTLDRGGNVVIPSFAVGRTQELLFIIRQIKAEGLIQGHDGFRVIVDSPLANEATGIFMQCDHSYFDEATRVYLDKGINPLTFPGLEMSVSLDESRAINTDPDPKVIISASGMCEAGRIRHHLKHNLWRKESLILFVGYQAEGTLGRSLYDGAKKVKLFGEDIEVNAEIDFLANISGHADRDGLLEWMSGFAQNKPVQVFVNHGEDASCRAFTAELENLGFTAMPPYSGTIYDLAEGCFVKIAEPVVVEHEEVRGGTQDGLYGILSEAGKKLLDLISRMKGRPNKEIKKLTNEINELNRKWGQE